MPGHQRFEALNIPLLSRLYLLNVHLVVPSYANDPRDPFIVSHTPDPASPLSIPLNSPSTYEEFPPPA